MIQLIFEARFLRFNESMRHYLIPLDGSKVGESALPWAKFLSSKAETELHLLRCYHPLAAVYSYPDFATPPPVAYDLSGFLRTSEKYLLHTAQEHGLSDAKALVQEGDAADIIVQQSELDSIDAVLMSSHGRGGIGRWLLGSVTTKVVRSCRKPVFIFRPEHTEPKLDKILVCLDGSALAETALKSALKLAEQFNSSLHLFRAVEYTPYPVSDVESALAQEVKDSHSYLDSLVSKHPDFEMTTEVQTTNPVDGILKSSSDCDLICISSHGRGGFERWLLGSVAEKVLHRSKKPLMVVFGKE